MIKLFIFDMGGVVSRNTNMVPEVSAYLEFDGATMIDLARDDFKELTTGRITVGEFTQRFSKKSGRVIKDDLLTRFFSPELDPDVVATIHSLKSRARVVVGTNTIAPHYEVHRQRDDYHIFDAVYASHLMGQAKPDREFYSYILEKEECPPDQAVFIDDIEINVEGAGKLGIRALHFTGASQLEKDLSLLK